MQFFKKSSASRLGRSSYLQGLLNRLIYSRIFGTAVLVPIVRHGQKKFEKSRKTSYLAYVAMRKLFGNEDSELFENISRKLRVGGVESDSERTFDGLASTEIEFAIKQLQTYGYFILSQALEESKCAELERIALEADCILIDAFPNYSSEKFCSSDPIAARYVRQRLLNR